MASRAPGRQHAKRARRGHADSQDALSGSDWRDWASLTAGPAALIAERALANDVADYVHFRAVCTTWRACSDDPRVHSFLDRRFHPGQWIMLPRDSDVPNRRRRRFLNTQTGKCIQVPVPDLPHYYILGRIVEGLLVVCQKSIHIVKLLNPLTGQLAEYPHAACTVSPTRTSWSCKQRLAGSRDWWLSPISNLLCA
ncbi:hypothetical protein PR202_gb21336 [Eleusine coracana subsp. coracana]|uniref:F-box protein n=1 Tax=Eleusine coracana subsp. coracana TaxID=191504 RepID=A0AAV5FEX5_ELECO|nr:hypothetical protein PR202_gb21336 [Eleusine coracana subsp. coracana]